MNADVIDINERNHRQFLVRESRRALSALERLAGLDIIELRDELRQPDGTRAWGDWSALTHLPPRKASR